MRPEVKLAQTHVALTGPTRQQILQLMMARPEVNSNQFEISFWGTISLR